MKVAIVHDYLNQRGGAEKVLAAVAELFPDAPIYTLIADAACAGAVCPGREIRTSWLQSMPLARRLYPKYLPLYPFFIEQFDLSGYDLVVSDSSAWAKGVLTFPPTCHVSYLHTPMRFAWDNYHSAAEGIPKLMRGALKITMTQLRVWDVVATRRADFLACNSNAVRTRILKYYGRDAEVVAPPVDTSFFTPAENGARLGGKEPKAEPYFLMVCRLKPYKRVDLAVDAFRDLPYRLVIVGDGAERDTLRKRAAANVTFVTDADDLALREYYRHAAAFLMPAQEDFGIAPVEAMACGTPVIALRQGGALDTVVDGITGVFFAEQTAAALRAAVLAFRGDFDPQVLRAHAVRYDTSRFKARFADFVWSCYEEYRRNFSRARARVESRATVYEKLAYQVPA